LRAGQTVVEQIEDASTSPRIAVREMFEAIKHDTLSMEQVLNSVSYMMSELSFEDLAMEICRAQRHGTLTQVQAAQWMVWALDMQHEPPEVRCEAHALAREPGRGVTEIYGRLWTHCTWRGQLPPSGMCPRCGSRLPNPRVDAEKHLVKMIAQAQGDGLNARAAGETIER
jgi:hypothetical protein